MRIGLILNVLDEDYQIAIFRGIKERAAELGLEMFCIQQENHHFLEKALVSDFPKEEFLKKLKPSMFCRICCCNFFHNIKHFFCVRAGNQFFNNCRIAQNKAH